MLWAPWDRTDWNEPSEWSRTPDGSWSETEWLFWESWEERTRSAYLTGALANEDSRVRKESVLSLAKLGGRDAEALLIGMLDDGDPSVRAATCRALGILKSPRSVKPLVEVLRDESLDVQVEGLQALGQIGDPGVVRTIEKRALGGLFSKAPREVRIAAFRALAGIGTPGALRALEKGANGSRPARENGSQDSDGEPLSPPPQTRSEGLPGSEGSRVDPPPADRFHRCHPPSSGRRVG